MKTDTLTTPSPELKQHAQDLRRDINNVSEDLKNHANKSYAAVKDEAQARLSDAQDRAGDFANNARSFIQEHPFSAFGIGVLTGVVLTSWLRK